MKTAAPFMPSCFVRPKGSFRYGLIRPFRRFRAVLGRSLLRLCQQRAFSLRLQDLVQENLRSDWRGVATQSHMALKKSDLGRQERRSVTIFQVVADLIILGSLLPVGK